MSEVQYMRFIKNNFIMNNSYSEVIMQIKHKLITGCCIYIIFLMSPLFSFAETINYTYDSLNRIVREERSNGAVIVYVYDSAGNRTAKVVSGSPVTTTTTIPLDTDNDGIPDTGDNCPNKPNGPNLGICSSTSDKPGVNCNSDVDCANGCSSNGLCIKDQRDTDNDGKGDVCDNCPAVCNPQQLDADTDGLGDLCDTTPGCGGCGLLQCEQPCP
jgi:YD repeat-containing protein